MSGLEHSHGLPLILSAALLVAVSCGLLSFFVVHRNLAFMTHGIAHSMVAGVGLALLMHWTVFWPAMITAVVLALGIGWVTRRGRLAEDSAIGIVLSGALALGIFLAARPHEGHDGHEQHAGHVHDLESYLVGSLDHVLESDLIWLIAFAALAVILVIRFWHPLLRFAYDPEGAQISGYPVETIRFGILTALAITIALTMRVVGILLVGALLIIPAAAAGFWSARAVTVIFMAVLIAVVGAAVGVILAATLHAPAGATVILTLVALFLVSRIFGPYRT